MSFLPESFEPKVHTEFWCNKCDHRIVDSNNKDTGSFFVMFGHVYQSKTKNYDGDYQGVMFAICSHCLNHEEL